MMRWKLCRIPKLRPCCLLSVYGSSGFFLRLNWALCPVATETVLQRRSLCQGWCMCNEYLVKDCGETMRMKCCCFFVFCFFVFFPHFLVFLLLICQCYYDPAASPPPLIVPLVWAFSFLMQCVLLWDTCSHIVCSWGGGKALGQVLNGDACLYVQVLNHGNVTEAVYIEFSLLFAAD